MSLRFRQVHLDFHTSEKISGVGARFDAKQFQEELKRGHVDSITLFSKCHHGMTYHDTAVGVRHPGMERELLPRQIEACHAIGVRTPIYLSAGLDEAMARLRPEWCVLSREGTIRDPLAAGWKTLNFASPYLDYLCAQIEEVVARFGADDGIFLDIIAAQRSYDAGTLQQMLAENLDPLVAEDVETFAQNRLQNYYARTTASCKTGNDARPVFHNSGHIPKGATNKLKWNSHLELESLPTGGWGYDHFPLSAKYAATTGYDFLGMTGKFHTSWGEFGGFKRAAALRYECAAMLAFGAKCSVGDQLHPSGEMNRDTYALVGAAYQEVEAKQKWCENVSPISDIALVSSEAAGGGKSRGTHAEEGAARMLLELHQQFDVVDLERDLSGYKVVVLPDEIVLEGEFLEKIRAYRASGGKLLFSGASGLNAARDRFALDIGLTLRGKSEFDPDYIIPTEFCPTSPVRGAFVVHGGAWNVEAKDAEVLAHRADSYFNRTWEHFCSHQHAPDAQTSEFPAVVAGEDWVYFAHAIFTRYRLDGQPLFRDLVQDALARLLPTPRVETTLPTSARVSLMQQKTQLNERTILHLLFAVPVKRGENIEIIEDLFPLQNIECAVRVSHNVSSVRLVPSNEELNWTRDGDAIRFTVPMLLCHQIVEIDSAGS